MLPPPPGMKQCAGATAWMHTRVANYGQLVGPTAQLQFMTTRVQRVKQECSLLHPFLFPVATYPCPRSSAHIGPAFPVTGFTRKQSREL